MKSQLKILHLEDNAHDADLVKRCLERANLNCGIKVVCDKIDFQNSLKYFSPDVVLSDHTLPQFDSDQALKIAKAYGATAGIPFILVTGTVSEEYAVQILKEGADDYILKKNLARLPSAITNALKQREAEQNLKRNEKRFRALIENSNDGIGMLNEKGEVIYVTPSASKIDGFSADELTGKVGMGQVHPDDMPRAMKMMEDAFKNPGLPVYSEHRIKHKSGRWVWTEGTMTNFLHDPDIHALVVNFRDITGRKIAEEKIKESETRLRTTLDTLLEGVQIIGYDFRYLYVNDAVAQQGKSSKEALLGHTMMERYPGIENTEMFSLLRKCMTERTPAVMENEFTYPDGTRGWFELSIQPAPEGAIILSMDITKRKMAEEKLIQSEKQIRNFAAYLNTSIEEERARIARELHDDLGQQLAGIKISLSFLKTRNKELENEINALLNSMDEAILAMRKAATALRPSILDTLGLLPSIQWLAEEFQKKSGIKCTVNFQAGEQDVQQDKAISVFRICQEALTNIMKHSKATMVNISVQKKENKVMLEIEDNGKGISGERLQNPFSMGLVGMKERAKIIQAELSISSRMNAGTVVQLTTQAN